MALIKKYEYKIFLILSGLLGLVPLSWFHGKLIAGEEFYALNYAKWIGIFGKAWEPYLNYGEPSILIPLKVQAFFFFLFDHMGLSAYSAQIIWYVFLWAATAVVCYLFLEKVFEKSVSGFALFVATIYYVYNPFFLNISPFLTPPRIIFIALPVVLNILYTVFKQKNVMVRQMFNFSIIIFLASPVFVNLPAGVVIIALIGLGLAYKYLILDKNYKNFLISSVYLSIFCVIVSLWWLMPVMQETLSRSDLIKTTSSTFTAVASSRINDVLSQFGSWAFREKIYGYDYYYFPYYKAYDTFPLLFLRYIPFIFIILGAYYLITIIKLRKELSIRDEFFIFILFIFCIFTFLSKGASGILGGVYEFMYLNFPFFWVFREPYAKFMPVVSATSVPLILLGYVYLSKLLANIKNASILILVSLSACFFAVGYPFLNGSVVWAVNDRDVRSYEIEMPSYWKDFISNWKPNSGYYLLFPSNGMTDRYIWPSGYIGNPYLLFTDARTINPVSSYILNQGSQRVIRYIYNKIFQDPKWISTHAERYNLSGLIFQADTSYSRFLEKRNFMNENYLRFASAVFDKIDLYDFISEDKKLTDFSVIPENKLLWINSAEIINYELLKLLVPDTAYFVFSDDTQRFNSFIVKEDKESWTADGTSEIFSLKDIKKDSYFGFIGDKYDFIKEINIDTASGAIMAANGIKLFELNTGSYIELKIKSPVEVNMENDWTLLQRVDSQNYEKRLVKGTKLDLSTTEKAYYKKLDGYDPNIAHLILLLGKYVGNSGFSIFTVQRDIDIASESLLAGGVIPQLDGQLTPILQKTDFLDTAINAEYYVVIKKPEPRGGGTARDTVTEDSLDLTSLRFFAIYHPDVFLIRKESFENLENNTVTSAEQKRIDDTIVLTKVSPSAQGSYLQFKNAYNDGWRLVNLKNGDWLKADTGSFINQKLLGLKIGLKAFSGKEPVNIEYYSNAWKLDTQNEVYAVVFLPEIKIRILFTLALIAIIAGLVRKKW